MTDAAFKEVIGFVREHSLPPLKPFLPNGMSIPIFVSDDYSGVPKMEFKGAPHVELAGVGFKPLAPDERCVVTRITVSHEDYSDLSHRLRLLWLSAAGGEGADPSADRRSDP